MESVLGGIYANVDFLQESRNESATYWNCPRHRYKHRQLCECNSPLVFHSVKGATGEIIVETGEIDVVNQLWCNECQREIKKNERCFRCTNGVICDEYLGTGQDICVDCIRKV